MLQLSDIVVFTFKEAALGAVCGVVLSSLVYLTRNRCFSDKDHDEGAWLANAISNNFLLTNLPLRDIQLLVEASRTKVFSRDNIIIRNGSKATDFFVVMQGDLEVFIPGLDTPVQRLSVGDTFGELALLHEEPRNATVRVNPDSNSPVILSSVDAENFSSIVEPAMSAKKGTYRTFLKKCSILETLSPLQRDKIAEALIPVDLKAGQILHSQGDMGENFYLVWSGMIDNVKDGEQLIPHRAGDFFGESVLLEKLPYTATYSARTDARVLRLRSHDFFVLFLGSLENVMRRIISQNAASRDNSKFTHNQNRIYASIDRNFILKTLPPENKRKLALAAIPKKFKAGSTLITKGDIGDLFYIVDEGELICYLPQESDDPKLLQEFHNGDSFGELALLYNEVRNATVKVLPRNDAKLWVIDKPVFRKYTRPFMDKKAKHYLPFLNRVKELDTFSLAQKEKVAEALDVDIWKAGDCLFQQGETGDRFYLVERGTVKVVRDGQQVAELPSGVSFGEKALIESTPRAAGIYAGAEGVTTLSIDAHGFFMLFQGALENVLRDRIAHYEDANQVKGRIMKAISENYILKTLTAASKKSLVALCAMTSFASGENIITEGDIGNQFYIVAKGQVDWLVNDEVIQTLEVGASFGELALLHNEPRSMTIRASLNHGVTMATIDKPDFLRIVEPEMKIKMDSYRPFLSKIELFEDFRTIHINKICEALSPEHFVDKEVIVNQGDEGDKFYIICSGRVKIVKDGQELPYALSKGDYFGEKALIERVPRAATLVAVGPVETLSIDSNGFYLLFLEATGTKMKDRIAQY